MKKILLCAIAAMLCFCTLCGQSKKLWDFESGIDDWTASRGILIKKADPEESKIKNGALKIILPGKSRGFITAHIDGKDIHKNKFAGILFWARASIPCSIFLSLESSGKSWSCKLNIDDAYWHKMPISFNTFKDKGRSDGDLLSGDLMDSVETLKIELENPSDKEMTLCLDAISLYGKTISRECAPEELLPLKDSTCFLADYENGLNASFALGDANAYCKEDELLKEKSIKLVKAKNREVLRIEKNNSRDSLAYKTRDNIVDFSGSIEFWVKLNWNPSRSGKEKAFPSFVFFSGNWKNKTMIYFYRRRNSTSLNFMSFKNGKQSNVCVNSTKLKKGHWHHIAATWDSGKAKIFIDGVLAGVNNDFNDVLAFGKFFYLGSSIGGNKLDGELSAFAISKYPKKIFPVVIDSFKN